MLRELVLDNPLLVKHCRARLRRRHLIPLLVLAAVVCLLAAWSSAFYGGADRETASAQFMFLLFAQGGVLLVLGTARAASGVVEARDSGMLDFHRISPQRPLALGVGFVLGGPIREWLLFACTTPFSLLVALTSGVDPLAWLALMVVLVVTAVFYHLVATLAALSVPELRGGAAGIVLLVLFLHLWAFPFVVGGGLPLGHLTVIPTVVVAVDPTSAADILPPGLPPSAVTALLLALLYQVPLAFFAAIAVERKMRDQAAAPYSKPAAILFYLAVAALVVLGVAIAPQPRDSWTPGFPVAWATYALFGIGMLLTVAVTPSRAQFIRGIRQARKVGLADAPAWSDEAVNWSVVSAFAPLLFTASLAAHAVSPASVRLGLNTIAGSAVAVLAFAFFGYAKQALDLAYGKLSRTYLGALIFALWGLPLLLAMLLASASGFETPVEPILAASPIAGIYLALSEPIRAGLPLATGIALIVTLVPAIGFALINPGQARRVQWESEQK